MQMRQIWTRRWIAGNNTLHSSNRGGSLSQHSLLFCCFHKKAASVVGKFPLGWVLRVWSSGINNLLSHDTHLPWDYTLLIRDGTKHFTWCVQRSHFPVLLAFAFDGLGAFSRMNLRWYTICDQNSSGSDSPLLWGHLAQQPFLGKKAFWEKIHFLVYKKAHRWQSWAH